MMKVVQTVMVVLGLALLLLFAVPIIWVIIREFPQRGRRRTTQCVSNIYQTVMALKVYADDHEGKLPFVGTQTPAGWKPRTDKIRYETEQPRLAVWPVILDPYIRSPAILACPLCGASEQRPFSYFLNRRLSGLRARAVRYPASCIVLGDWVAYGYITPAMSTTWDIARAGKVLPLGAWDAARRHQGRGVYALLEGHAKWLGPSEIAPCPRGRLKPDPKRPSFVP